VSIRTYETKNPFRNSTLMSDDFLENYLTFCKGNEVPPSYHRWAGVAALSTLVSRGVWYDAGIYEDHCNMYIVLVGKPADKKSTAMGICRKLIQECGVKIAPSSVTKQRIYELMDSANKKAGYLSDYAYEGVTYPVAQFPMFCNEMVTMLSAGGDALGMIEFLTDIWDRPFFDVDTKNAGSNVIHGPYITILGCMTPDQTGSLVKQDIITGGFSRRCIIVTPDETPPPVPRPTLTEEQHVAWSNCVRIGKELRSVRRKFTFTDEAQTLWDKWYGSVYRRQHENHPAVVLNFFGSLARYGTQLSMLFELSRDRTAAQVHVDMLQKAIDWLEPLQYNLSTVFAGAGRNYLATITSKIIAQLARNKQPMPAKIIHVALWNEANEKEFEEAMKFLKTSGQIVEVIIGGLPHFSLPNKDLTKSQPLPSEHKSSPTLGIDLGPLSEVDLSDEPSASVED